MSIAIDFGSYSAIPDAAMMQCWRDQGVTRCIIGTRGNIQFNAQVEAAIAGGFEVEVYEYLYFNQNGGAQMEVCKARCKPYPQITRIWLDVELEDGDPNPGTAAVMKVIDDALYVRESYACGIYTSYNYWVRVFGLGDEYNHLPLWNAYYDNDPDIDFDHLQYGGWTAVAMEQYAGSTDLCGENVDLSQIVEQEEDMPLTDQDKRDIAAIVTLQLELFRQQMEKDGQLTPRKP